jgi:transcriptional regulator with XRE-family HTH domain
MVSLGFRRRVHDFIGVCHYDILLPIGGRLKERREYAGITRKEFAAMINVDVHTVAAWEEHGQPPTFSNMEKISRFLKTSFC